MNNTLQAVKSYSDENDFPLKNLNYDFLVRFENFCKKRGNSTNTIAVYMRTIKMIFNRGIKTGVVKQEQYPFSGYKIRTMKTKKRAVPREVIELIEKLELEENTRIWHARNYFLFSFYAMGMNFADMAYLKLENIIEGRIEYKRQKTKKQYSIKITPQMDKILQHYIHLNESGDYIFPIIINEGKPKQEYQEFFEKRRIYNKPIAS
ncbi:MAG: site-specific integrase [Bacteroidales bacterium]